MDLYIYDFKNSSSESEPVKSTRQLSMTYAQPALTPATWCDTVVKGEVRSVRLKNAKEK